MFGVRVLGSRFQGAEFGVGYDGTSTEFDRALLTRTIARGYAAENILAFAVAPGFTVSEMTEEYLTGRGGAQIVADIPLGRVASTVEVAETIRWLATEAPPSATGTIIDVNGASYVR